MRLTPQQWNDVINDDTPKDAKRNLVEIAAFAYLAGLEPGQEVPTDNVLDAIYPRAEAEKSLRGHKTRFAIYKILATMPTKELKDCCRKTEATGKFMGKTFHHWAWFKPPERKCCPACGQPITEKFI